MKMPHKRRFATTFIEGLPDPSFAARAQAIGVPPGLDKLPRRPFSPADELTLFLRVLRAALSAPALLLFSSRGYLKPELLAIILLGLLPRSLRPAIVLYGEMWAPSGGWRGRIERLVMGLADRGIDRYVVYSSAERQVFAENWGVSAEKIRFCPFYIRPRTTLDAPASQASEPPGEHVFAGGNSFRDYEPLIAAARRMPDVHFYIGTVRLEGRDDLPPNIHTAWFPRDEWDRLVRTAAVVAVPLRRDTRRTAGLLTLLEAMWSRRPLIVSDALGVRDYVSDGVSGLVVDGSAEGYERALRRALTPEGRQALAAMGEAGHQAVCEQFTLAKHCAALLHVLDEVARPELSAEGQPMQGAH